MVWAYPTNITGLGELLVYANSVTAGYYGSTMTAVFTAVLFLIMGADDKALMTAGFSGMLISIFMNIMGIVNSWIIMIYVSLMIAGMLWNWTSN